MIQDSGKGASLIFIVMMNSTSQLNMFQTGTGLNVFSYDASDGVFVIPKRGSVWGFTV